MNPGSRHYTWVHRDENNGRNCNFPFVAESPDGSYVIAAGTRETALNRYNAYVVKLDAKETGKSLSVRLLPLRSKKAGRFEQLLDFARSHSIVARG